MNRLSELLIAGAAVTTAAAVASGANLQIAIPAGAAAVVLIAAVGAIHLQSTATHLAPAPAGMIREAPQVRFESDSLLRLRRAFRSGEIGRRSILATIRALERDLIPGEGTPLTLDSERALLEFPANRFQEWIDDRLKRIEAVT